jgi:AhpD family alkylhydroperoxidase
VGPAGTLCRRYGTPPLRDDANVVDETRENERRRHPMPTRPEVYKEIKETLGLVPQWLEQMSEGGLQGFWVLARDFWLKETKIPNKYKELIGVAVSGATRCKYCALFHTEAARLFGATDEEISEASMMGALTMCGSTFLNSQQIDYEKFRQETRDIISFVKRKL